MNFRFKRGSRIARLPAGTVGVSRKLGLGAALCLVLGGSAFAQATLDFIDPLDTERAKIEERGGSAAPAPAPAPAPATPRIENTRDLPPPRLTTPPARGDDSVLIRARDGAVAGTDAVREGATGFWGTLRSTLSSVAIAMGLPTIGLVALLGLFLAGLAALVGWTLFRRKRSRGSSARDDVYARSSRDNARRRMADSAPTPRPAMVAEEDDFEETMPEDFDSIFADEREEPVRPREPAGKAASDGWRKPNLDRLRDSIKADWKADKAERAEKPDTRPPAAAPPRPEPRAPLADPAPRTLDDLSDGWEAWDAQDDDGEDPWGDTSPTTKARTAPEDETDTATDRIRALRESLRVS